MVAPVAPMARATARLVGGSSHCTRPSRYFVMLQLTTRSMSSGSPSRPGEAVARRTDGEGERVLVAHRHPALVDAGQPLEIDVGVVASGRHQVLGGEVRLRQRAPDAGEAGDVRRTVAVGRSLGEHPPGGCRRPRRSVALAGRPVPSAQLHHVSRVREAGRCGTGPIGTDRGGQRCTK